MRSATILVGVLALVGAAVAGVVVVSAQERDQPTPPARDQFLERLAAHLGVDVESLTGAIRAARIDTVDVALADGRITSEQAVKARERIERGGGSGGGRLRGRHAFDKRHQRVEQARGAVIESAAAAIGLSGDDLRAELKGGNSIADIASTRGLALVDVKARILLDARARLDQAVANGRIDKPRAHEMFEKLSQHLDEVLNKRREAPAP